MRSWSLRALGFWSYLTKATLLHAIQFAYESSVADRSFQKTSKTSSHVSKTQLGTTLGALLLTSALLNICMPYSAQDEICTAMSACECGVPLSPAEIDAHLMVSRDIPVDLLVRTSKVARLSDFLLWQVRRNSPVQ